MAFALLALMQTAWLAGVACLALGCGPASENATLSGQVVLTGNADDSGVLVTYSSDGADTPQQTTTPGSGAYSFSDSNVSDTTATVVASADSTLEGSLSAQVSEPYSGGGNDAVTVPTFVFTPFGAVSVTVTVGGSASAGILVALEGTSITGVTDDAGRCTLNRVPVGTYAVIASSPGHTPASIAGQVVRYKATTQVPSLGLQ